MKNKIYLAAPWLDRELMPERAKVFEDAGFTITHKWWEYEGESQENESEEFLRECAASDFNGVTTADVLIAFNTAKSEGKATEQGIALASKVPIISINPPVKVTSNIFHHLPQYTHVNSIEEALEEVKKICHQ